jgi:hypothetical protein
MKNDTKAESAPVRMRQYGCVKCQTIHTEPEPLFQEHIMHQSKHGWNYVEAVPAPAGGHTPGPLQYVERFDARMWPAQSGWGPMTRQDIESIHESLPALRVIVNSHASLLAERDRLKAALEKIDRACQSWVGQTEIQGIARDALAEGGE